MRQITTEELMLGNWVQHEEGFYQLEAIGQRSVRIATPGGGSAHEIEYIKPIQITNEILAACGFEPHPHVVGTWIHREQKKLELQQIPLSEDDTSGWWWKLVHKAGYPLQPIEYLHELQNQYYFIFGKKLEVDL